MNNVTTDKPGKAILWLIPVPLTDEGLAHIPAVVPEILANLRYIIAERAKTARRWIKKINPRVDLSTIEIFELNKHGEDQGLTAFLKKGAESGQIGLMSEAGCPGVADPGAEVVAIAHRLGMQVKPISGPSSILLALMASGMEGQHFSFKGYLPAKKPELKVALKQLENQSKKEKCTMIFIETPYRNGQVVESCLENLSPGTRLCIAKDLTSPTEWIYSAPVSSWNPDKIPDLHKIPCIFLISYT